PQLRKLRGCEQVAAVCYRVGGGGIEFLLVRTRSGRWTFPQGGLEPGLTHAQDAALEAFEEAGVHGRMEEASFARYIRRKRGGNGHSAAEVAVNAHLCEVLRLDPPQEANRNPTWFSAGQAKRRLQEDRTPDYGAEFARVVDRAVARIQRLRSATSTSTDALHKVQFEVFEPARFHNRMEQASSARYMRREPAAAIELAVDAHLCKVLQLEPPQGFDRRPVAVRVPQLTSGPNGRKKE
ncbi:MAG TPA: NUDIX domain-containing protein, partial [Terriglobales bacterium]|nr:NUDIX domain-containing protein [Terriglobales bacterium]